MRQHIPQFSTPYNYQSAQQVNNIISGNNASVINYHLTSQQLITGLRGNINAHPRKSIKESTLETEGPIPEKDEVKKAEQRTMEQQKKIDRKQPKKDK